MMGIFSSNLKFLTIGARYVDIFPAGPIRHLVAQVGVRVKKVAPLEGRDKLCKTETKDAISNNSNMQ